jgi:hypothetical protein
MSNDVVIRVENLGKKYLIRHQQRERYPALRDVMANKFKAVGRKVLQPMSHELRAIKKSLLFSVPVLVMRKKTERIGGIVAGTAKLVGTDSEKIYSETKKLLEGKKLYQKMSKANNPYGDGKAADRIVSVLVNNDQK